MNDNPTTQPGALRPAKKYDSVSVARRALYTVITITITSDISRTTMSKTWNSYPLVMNYQLTLDLLLPEAILAD